MSTHITLTGYQWLTDEDRHSMTLTIGASTIDVLGDSEEDTPWRRSIGALEALVFSAGHWTNVRLVHDWFMIHTYDDADGIISMVESRDLASLVEKLGRVLADPAKASDVFAPSVYGQITDSDLPELRRTMEIIKIALALPCDEYRVEIS